jgi:predicted house-cleaning noncanonical NTP pyrophosphatase (MazG superfamily)
MIIHNKLVRDKVPENIEAAGKKYKIDAEMLKDNDKFLFYLSLKFDEELKELYKSIILEKLDKTEFADVLEVYYTLLELYNIDMAEIEQIRLEKKEKLGGFSKRIFLQQSEE